MKKVFAILALAASLAACARMEQPVDETPVATPEGTETPARTYTLTVRATKDAGTRVLELDGTTNTLNAKWESGDKVEVYEGETRLGELTAGAVAHDGMSCTFSGELEGLPDETSSLTLKYLSPAYEEQDGTLEYISENCDYAEAEVNVTVEGTTITCGDAVFVSRQAVVKFLLKDKSGEAVSATSFVVKDGETTYTVTPDEAASELFVALPGIADRPLSLSATAGNATYTYWKSGVTLNAGKYYSIAVRMDPTIDLGNVDIYNSDGIFTAQDGNILTGTSPEGKQVRIAGGATVTLRDVSIVHREDIQHDGIAPDGSATLLLEGTNTVGGGSHHAGISVPEGSTLTIDGGGSLTATGGYKAAGIGGGYNSSCGAITILGGTVTATGGKYAAGIGSGEVLLSIIQLKMTSCGAITILGGEVTATGGNCAAGIGSGYVGARNKVSCGAITISGGTVTATGGGSDTSTGGGSGAGIGSGWTGKAATVSLGTITISGGSVTSTGGYEAADIGRGTAGEAATVSGGAITLQGDGILSNRIRIADNATVTLNGVNLPEGIELAGSATINLAGENTVSADEGNAGISVPETSILTIDGDGSLTAYGGNGEPGIDGGTIVSNGVTFSGSISERVQISSGATVTLNGVNLPKGIALAGSATINLAGVNTVSADEGNAGISVPSGSTLTLQGTGSLTATGGRLAAGIGSGYNSSCGDISISDGTVTATGETLAAGIGSGYNSSCGDITISGGSVTATGGENAAGIGSGTHGSCGAITISGGIVEATGGLNGVGIGSGLDGSCDNISISTLAQVKATKDYSAEFSIGPARSWFPCGTVTINGEVWGYWTGSSFYVDNGRLNENPLYINWQSE